MNAAHVEVPEPNLQFGAKVRPCPSCDWLYIDDSKDQPKRAAYYAKRNPGSRRDCRCVSGTGQPISVRIHSRSQHDVIAPNA